METGQLSMMGNPANSLPVDGEGNVVETVPIVPVTGRPLSSNQRLMLERVRSAAAGSPQTIADLADKGLSREVPALASLDARRTMLGNVNGATTATLNDFRPVMEQLVQPLQVNSSSGDESAYSQLMGGVQRSTGVWRGGRSRAGVANACYRSAARPGKRLALANA